MDYYHHSVDSVKNLLLSFCENNHSDAADYHKIYEAIQILKELEKNLRQEITEDDIRDYQENSAEMDKKCKEFLLEICSEKKCCCQKHSGYQEINQN